MLQMENSLMVQWLGLRAFTVNGLGSISVWGTKAIKKHLKWMHFMYINHTSITLIAFKSFLNFKLLSLIIS